MTRPALYARQQVAFYYGGLEIFLVWLVPRGRKSADPAASALRSREEAPAAGTRAEGRPWWRRKLRHARRFGWGRFDACLGKVLQSRQAQAMEYHVGSRQPRTEETRSGGGSRER